MEFCVLAVEKYENYVWKIMKLSEDFLLLFAYWVGALDYNLSDPKGPPR